MGTNGCEHIHRLVFKWKSQMIDLMNYPPGNVFIAFDLINYSPGRVFITLLLVHNFHRLIPHFLQCASYLFVLKSITKGTFSMGIFFFFFFWTRVDYWLSPSRWWDTAVIVIIPCKLYTCSQNNHWLAALYFHCWGVVFPCFIVDFLCLLD